MSEFLIYGFHSVKEAIEAGRALEKIMIRQDMSPDRAMELRRLAQEIDVPLQMVPEIKLNKVTKNGNHQGVVAVMPVMPYQPLEETLLRIQDTGETPLLLMLDGVTDVRNFGAIARSAECLGVHAIIVPTQGSASMSADAVKVSAGALSHITVCRVKDLVDATLLLQAYGIKTYGLNEKANATLWQTDLTEAACLVMGSEENGISPRLIRRVDELVQIPLRGKVGSLNVSVAAGIALAEVERQRMTAS
ncbi:MAG: 23S rRNA (guanosine(2251)-2'-O)-methyltransferase RlmB [Bacteroidia bacterium]|nr:23S rRNA (guanosine(2251)-2'-O)-methyltransferase RlmB [Bacteroidia bacterium]